MGDFRDGGPSGAELTPGLIHPGAQDIFPRRHAHLLLEAHFKAGLGQSGLRGQGGDGEGFVESAGDPVQNRLERDGSAPAGGGPAQIRITLASPLPRQRTTRKRPPARPSADSMRKK